MDHEDVFYAEVERRILQLMAGDDEDDFMERYNNNNNNNWKSLCGTKRGLNNGYTAAKQPGNYFDWTKDESSNSVPTWLLNLWRPNGNGTGVFIPQIAKSRTRNKPRRRNNERGRTVRSSKEVDM